jgi:hypothetical protein
MYCRYLPRRVYVISDSQYTYSDASGESGFVVRLDLQLLTTLGFTRSLATVPVPLSPFDAAPLNYDALEANLAVINNKK